MKAQVSVCQTSAFIAWNCRNVLHTLDMHHVAYPGTLLGQCWDSLRARSQLQWFSHPVLSTGNSSQPVLFPWHYSGLVDSSVTWGGWYRPQREISLPGPILFFCYIEITFTKERRWGLAQEEYEGWLDASLPAMVRESRYIGTCTPPGTACPVPQGGKASHLPL